VGCCCYVFVGASILLYFESGESDECKPFYLSITPCQQNENFILFRSAALRILSGMNFKRRGEEIPGVTRRIFDLDQSQL
jgi:hypothetical protein